ncbi:hypothetical protein AAMO2058_001589100 [Amorphochlora amoebiformis]
MNLENLNDVATNVRRNGVTTAKLESADIQGHGSPSHELENLDTEELGVHGEL